MVYPTWLAGDFPVRKPLNWQRVYTPSTRIFFRFCYCYYHHHCCHDFLPIPWVYYIYIYICWINKFINQLDNMYIVCIYIYIHIHTRETWPVYMTASSIRRDSCLDLTKHQGKITGRSNPYLRNGMAVTSIKWMCPCDQNFALCICHPSYSI